MRSWPWFQHETRQLRQLLVAVARCNGPHPLYPKTPFSCKGQTQINQHRLLTLLTTVSLFDSVCLLLYYLHNFICLTGCLLLFLFPCQSICLSVCFLHIWKRSVVQWHAIYTERVFNFSIKIITQTISKMTGFIETYEYLSGLLFGYKHLEDSPTSPGKLVCPQ